MPGVSDSQRVVTPVLRRAPTGTLLTEIGGSVFYHKAKITQMSVSTNSLTSQNDSHASAEDESAISAAEPLKPGIDTISSRFPKLQEYAHFHYERVELAEIQVSLYEPSGSALEESHRGLYHGLDSDGSDYFFTLIVSSSSTPKTWLIRRTYRDFRKFDRQLHKCIYDRKFSQLEELIRPDFVDKENLEAWKNKVSVYLARFSEIAGNLINCAPVLNWLELDNHGFRLIASDDSAINTPAVAAVHVVKRYVAQAGDELALEVGDMLSVIDMPPAEESIWWRGKKELDVGFFPSDCVEVIGGGKMPPTAPSLKDVPVLRKRGKLIAFFRSFLSARPSRRRLKESGILKERVFGCDLGEYLTNTGQKVPAVLVQCTSFIEEHMHNIDGIYRLSGITSNIQRLRQEFDAESTPDLTQDIYMQDIHSVASVLKLYFRELPNPLLTYQLYEKFVDAVESSEELRLLKIHDVVNQLPPPHFRTLEYLMRHLARIATYSDKTGMNSKNLAIVWAPNLLRSSDHETSVEALRGVGTCAVAVEHLVKYADVIFSNQLHTCSLLSRAGNAAKNNRPKSVAVSTPSKLLSIDEARLMQLPKHDLNKKFIDVGAGSQNVPQFHTVISLPKDRKKRSNSTKSTQRFSSSWRSIFTTNRSRKPLRQSQFEPISEPFNFVHVNKKLRTTQSTNSLDSSPLLDSGKCSVRSKGRKLSENEPQSLRITVNRKSPTASHSRTFSLDSCFNRPGELEHRISGTNTTVADVVKTVPYADSESGCLVRLAIDEEPELQQSEEVYEDARSQPPTSSSSEGVMRMRSKPVTVPGARYTKLCRTLSPEFLRRYREPLVRGDGSGIKRSLSVSPTACRFESEAVSDINTAYGEVASVKSDSRKSFRRSTSDEDLRKAMSLSTDLSMVPQCSTPITDIDGQCDMEGVNESDVVGSAETCQSHVPVDRKFPSVAVEHASQEQEDSFFEDIRLAESKESLHVQAAVECESDDCEAAALVAEGPLGHDLKVEEAREATISKSPSSLLEMEAMISPHHPLDPKVGEKIMQNIGAMQELSINGSSSYFFGQSDSDSRRRKLEWFDNGCKEGEDEEQTGEANLEVVDGSVFSSADSELDTSLECRIDSSFADVTDLEAPCVGTLDPEVKPLHYFGQDSPIFDHVVPSVDEVFEPETPHSNEGQVQETQPQTKSGPVEFSVELRKAGWDLFSSAPSSHRYTWSEESVAPPLTALKRVSLPPVGISSVSSSSDTHFMDQSAPAIVSPSVFSKSLEYVLVLEKPLPPVIKPVDQTAPSTDALETAVSPLNTQRETTPPSVRNLRNRFESTGSVINKENECVRSERCDTGGTLRQKLKELSDVYRENPVWNPSPVPVKEPASESEIPKVPFKPVVAKKPVVVERNVASCWKEPEVDSGAVSGSLRVKEMRRLFQPSI